jgi:hypothetical protein
MMGSKAIILPPFFCHVAYDDDETHDDFNKYSRDKI